MARTVAEVLRGIVLREESQTTAESLAAAIELAGEKLQEWVDSGIKNTGGNDGFCLICSASNSKSSVIPVLLKDIRRIAYQEDVDLIFNAAAFADLATVIIRRFAKRWQFPGCWI
jgi:hypothetical protein